MSGDSFNTYLLFAAVLLGVLAVANLFQIRKRGRVSGILAAACLVLAGTLMLYRATGPSVFVYILAAIVLLLMLAHAALVSAEKQRAKKTS